MFSIYLSCPKGIESLLLEEAQRLGLLSARETTGGVSGECELDTMYQLCLWSRLASRVLLVLVEAPVTTLETLQAHIEAIDWSGHLRSSGTMKVEFSGELKDVNNELFGAMRVKDIVVDQFRYNSGVRPSVDRQQPDITIDVRIRKGKARIAIDMSGEPMHRRGYRLQGAKAPLKENLAAALLIRAGWPEQMLENRALIDPMCGSGTLLIEAAWMAGDRAPGLTRSYWGFTGWRHHQPDVWQEVVQQARLRRTASSESIPPILGYDADQNAIQASLANIERAGLKGNVWAYHKELAHWVKPTHLPLKDGLLICNPPYGERLGEQQALKGLYRYLGVTIFKELPGWNASIFTGNPELAKSVGFRAKKKYRLNNGSIDCQLINFELTDEWRMRSGPASVELSELSLDDLSEGSRMVANRIRKNMRAIKSMVKQQQWQAYRIYDADIPEYSAAIDIYGDWLHVAEYAAPQNIPEETTKARLGQILDALPVATGIPDSRIVVKERSRQKGKKQYVKLDSSGSEFAIQEGEARLLVNLKDYLDTGLFLDHRPIRLQIAKIASGKRFLNLYSYTGAVTVHAAVGGARQTVSIDLSNTYQAWARRNLDANGLSENHHKTVVADCFSWLKDPANSSQKFDLIFMDPPTFSNSKKMANTLDIQRDHAELLRVAMNHLTEDGLLIFSNNKRGFKLDSSLTEKYRVKDISAETIPRDFNRNKKIHQCWEFRHLDPVTQTNNPWLKGEG